MISWDCAWNRFCRQQARDFDIHASREEDVMISAGQLTLMDRASA
jgi:hypothetical protein